MEQFFIKKLENRVDFNLKIIGRRRQEEVKKDITCGDPPGKTDRIIIRLTNFEAHTTKHPYSLPPSFFFIISYSYEILHT